MQNSLIASYRRRSWRHNIKPKSKLSAGPKTTYLVEDKSSIPSPAWALVHLAARYSEDAYKRGVKKSAGRVYSILGKVKISDESIYIHGYGRVIIVAVAGTRDYKDWMSNFNNKASQPTNVLANESNPCHAGFLETVRMLIVPLAECLRRLEKGATILFTGHSAGGAIASLLFAHVETMNRSALVDAVAESVAIHCIVFGTPPVSVLPLRQADAQGLTTRGSLFLSLLNEGDPISRADRGFLARRCKFPGWNKALLYDKIKPASSCACTPIADVPVPINRLFVNSGKILWLRVDSGLPPRLKIREVSNEDLEKDAELLWYAHKIATYRKRIAALPSPPKFSSVGSCGGQL